MGIYTTGELTGWFYAAWGAGWPDAVANLTVTIYATCTAAAPDSRTSTSPQVTAFWPPMATPTPTPPPSTPPALP